MGDVYLCDDSALGRRVAVKIMHTFDSTDPEAVTRFVLEGKALAKLTHPNIVSVFGLGEDKGYLYIAMEAVNGRSLYQLSRERRLNIREMISIFSDIAAGLDHAHSHGIVHRDIKPANILVDSFGRAKIIDFGIAKSIGGNPLGAEGVKTKTGAVIGTLNYIAPELFRGDPPSPGSDIYALGLIFFEMLTGRTPFKGESQFATMEMIRDGNLDIPETLKLVLPDETWDVLGEMIAHDPMKRPRTATDGANKLKQIKFPNLPSYFNSDLVSVRIENVDELQDKLEAEGIDPAEWQFVLSLAVRNQATKPAAAANEESTRLIESTGFHVNLDVLNGAIGEYRRDLDSILTMRRSEQLSSLTPPPNVQQFTPHTGNLDVSAVGQMTSTPMAPQMSPATSSYRMPMPPPPPVEEKKSKIVEWIVAVGLIGALGYGGWTQYEQRQRIEAALTTDKKPEARRRGGTQVEAPSAASMTAATKQEALPAGSGFAMVVEPSSDAWPPIQIRPMDVGAVRTWKWRVRSDRGEGAFVERRTWEGVEDGLLKVKVERLKRAPTGVVAEPAGFEWYQDGFYGVPRKSLRSTLFGSVSGAAIGQPGALFPLRKGKEVQFELTFKPVEAPGAPVELVKLQPTYRTTCSIRDKMPIKVTLGAFEVVKVDCAIKADNHEINDVVYWSVDLNTPVRHDRRVVSTANGAITEWSFVGELAENHAPNAGAAASVRNPTGAAGSN